mmetsp:Transcript_12892/g.29173  ORF Transcript_12892/g.29173 Transcript_12892/m.29173 type:complete len:761 (+) Transcript_12892:70-2352(+)
MVDDVEAGGANIFRILVATDTHIGYNEKDKVRCQDAINTFEEVLQVGRQRQVDCVLHGGDLFHDNKPTRRSLYKTMDLLRRYCLGPGEVGFQVVSDPAMFSRGLVNYEDPNINVDLPFFMIHGNHDDPGGESNLSAANLLEAASLVNYFGRAEDLEDIVVRPLLLQKGRTQVAIYGLGNVRDERLNRAFLARKVRFETPSNPSEWFNIMVLHQNRPKGNFGGAPSKACIHESMLPSFLDLVIWGHEHDCIVNPTESLRGEFYVVQPGSSVATALTPGETHVKHVAMLEVKPGGEFRCVGIPLWSVRPLVMRDVVMSEVGLLKTDAQAIWSALTSEVEGLIAQGEEECRKRKVQLEARYAEMSGGEGLLTPKVEAPEVPLVRLRVEHTGFDAIGNQTFGQQFVNRVGNPEEVLLFHRKKGGPVDAGAGAGGPGAAKRMADVGDALEIEEAAGPQEDGAGIQDIVYKYLDGGGQSLQLLSEPDLNDAVQTFVHRAEPCAIERFVKEQVEATNEAVLNEGRITGEEEIRVHIQDRTEKIRQQRLAAAEQAPAAPSGSGRGGGVADSREPTGLLEDPLPPEMLLGEASQVPVGAAASASIFGGGPLSGAQAAAPAARGGRGGGKGRARGRGKRASQDDELEAPPRAAKAPRSSRASAAAALPPAPAQPQIGRGARDLLFAGDSNRAGMGMASGGLLEQDAAVSAQVSAAAQAAAASMEAAGSAPFIRRRQGAAAEAFGGPETLGPGAGTQPMGPPMAKRQWALK